MAQEIKHVQFEPTTKSTPLRLYTDAAYNPDTNMAGAGIVVTDHSGVPIAVTHELIGKVQSVHVAETDALHRGLDYITHTPVNHCKVYTDRQGMLDSMDWESYDQYFHQIGIEWVSRTDNVIADKLATFALKGASEANR